MNGFFSGKHKPTCLGFVACTCKKLAVAEPPVSQEMKDRLAEALIPLSASESALLRAYASEVFARFSGSMEFSGITEHDAKPAILEVSQ